MPSELVYAWFLGQSGYAGWLGLITTPKHLSPAFARLQREAGEMRDALPAGVFLIPSPPMGERVRVRGNLP
jgi:hypothetical protein